jgi:hypothetical protein
LTVRLSLLIVCLAAMAGAGFHLFTSSQSERTAAAGLRDFQVNARTVAAAMGELRAAQQSYVAVGQGEDFWFARVTAIGKEIDDKVAALRASATAPEAVVNLESAATVLQEFMQMDLRAREYTRGRQLTLASDMVFADGFDLTKKVAEAIERALTAEEVARDAHAANVQRQQAMVLGGAAGVAVLVLLLLVPVTKKAEAQAVVLSVPPSPVVSTETLLDLNDFGKVTRRLPDPGPKLELDGVAALCSELARMPNTRSLPGLMERAAGVLDASGIVLWIGDPDGRELSPILVHGYPPGLATRLGTIRRDAENVTASAYRTALLQTVKGDTISNGAIAVPLVTAGGCVGVMAAEMKNGGEQQDALLSAASIIAAQLATLVGPPAVRTKAEAAG